MVLHVKTDSDHNTEWWPEERAGFEAFVDDHPRDPLPDTLTWETERVDRYNRAHWLVIDRLGDDGQVELLAHARQDLEPLLAEALERVGGTTGLVCAAAEELSAGAFDPFRDRAGLVERLDRARTTDHDDPVSADVDSADIDDRVVRFCLTRHEFVGVRNADDFLDAGEVLEDLGVGLTLLLPGDADRGAVRARDGMRLQPELFDVAYDRFDLFRPRAGIHHDEHRASIIDRLPPTFRSQSQ